MVQLLRICRNAGDVTVRRLWISKRTPLKKSKRNNVTDPNFIDSLYILSLHLAATP